MTMPRWILACVLFSLLGAYAQDCPKTQVHLGAAKLALADAEANHWDAQAGGLREEIANWKFNCLLESDDVQVRQATFDLEDWTVRAKAYVACRRARHWWQIWKHRCKFE
jgi:hypothetical protein